MRIIAALAVAIAAAVLFPGAAWAATAAPAPAAGSAADRDFTIDEYSLTASRAPDLWQVGAGVTLGNSYRRSYYLFGGGQVSWVKTLLPGRTLNGWALGAIGGFGFRPDRTWSPIATLAWDKLFNLDGAYGSRLTASTGVRFRVVPRLDQHYAISLLAFGSTLFGSGGVANKSDFGVAVTYSLAFFEPM